MDTAITLHTCYTGYCEKCWKAREDGSPCVLLMESKMVQLLRKIVRQFLRKLDTELPCDPATPHLGLYPK